MQQINVIKRDGEIEAWSFDKLVASIGKAGVEVVEAERLGREVENWVMNKAKDNAIESNDIRDKVIEVLMADYPAQSENYRVYKK